MIKLLLRIPLTVKHTCWLLLCITNMCFAQTPQIAELKEKLQQPGIHDTTRIQLLKKLSSTFTATDPKMRFYYADQFRALAEKIGDEKTVVDGYNAMGVSYGMRSKFDSAIYYFNKSLFRAEKIKYELGIGRNLSNIGFVYDRLDNKSEAIKYYFRGLEVFKAAKFLRGINQCYTNIGSIYFDLGQHKLALSYFSECLRSYTADKDSTGIGYALFTVGNCYQAMGEDEKALDAYNKSLSIRQKLGDLNGVGLVHRGLGLVYYHKKQYQRSIENFNKGVAIMEQIGDKYQQAALLMPLVEVYLATGDLNNAERSALQGLQLSREAGGKTGISELLHKAVKVYKAKNDIATAFKYQSEYVAMQDSILADKLLKDVNMTELKRTRTENAELVKDNSLKSTENTSNLAKIKQYDNILVVAACVLAFFALVMLILYRRNQEKQATNKQLLRQKEEIAQINKELELLNEEMNAQMELTHSQNLELERLNALKNKFFSIVSHDIRGPINTLQTLFSVYHAGAIEENELKNLLIKLEDTILTTGAFLDNLLEWSKSQLEGIKINPTDFNVSECIADNLHLFESKIELKKLKVAYLTKKTVMVHADRNMINLVIRNLLSNSIKFCDDGDEITLTAEIRGDRTIISIKDNGPGISQHDQEKLFSLEHTLSTGTQGEKGNHLGLILCRDMVMQNNGEISFRSELGNGTTFTISLPAAVTETFLKANL